MHSLTLQTSEATVEDGDILGRLGFAASSETGTEALKIAGKIEAIAEEEFDGSNNATEMVFSLAADGTAAAKMTLSSAGLLTVVDDIVIKSGGTIGGANDTDLLTLGNGALTVAGDTTTGILTIDKTSSATDAVTDVLVLKSQSSGIPAAGIGAGISFGMETFAENVEVGARIAAVLTDADQTNEDIDLVFYTMLNGDAATEALRVHDDGNLTVAGSLTLGTQLAVAQGGTGATTLSNLITLGTHTTGNYVATIADSGSGTITVANSGSETAAVTLDVAAAQTTITSIYNSSLVVGYGSSDANINFGTDNQITFDIDGTGQAVLKDGMFHPVTDSDVDLGKSDKYWKDAYIDTITTTGDVDVLGNIELGHASDTTIARASSGDISVEGNLIYRAGGTDVPVADGGTGASSLNNLITLGTHTTGNYVATIADAGNSAITVANSGSETAAVTLDIADNAVGIAELAGIARGKIIVGDASGNPALLAAGGNTEVLTMDSNGDVVWAAASGGTPTDITVADESSDTTCFPLFVTAVSGDLGPKTGTNLTFNSSTGVLTATGFAGPLTGDVTGNADTATTATNVTASANNSTDETVYPTFVDGATGGQGIETDTGLTYNPSTGTFTSTIFVGNLTGNASGTAATVTGATQAAITSAANLATVGTIGTGVWQGTAIATTYIADDAITGAKIALFDDSLAATTTHFLIADGTDYSSFALSGDVTCTNAGVVSLAAGAVDLAHMSSESVDEDNLHISNTGSNGQFLSKQSGNAGGLTWATASGSGDVAAGSDFSTNGVIMAANGTSKTIDVPGAALTTNGYAMTVSADAATPFTADGGAGTSNTIFDFKAGTGDADNHAIIRLLAGNGTASSYIYMGDTDTANIGYIRYKQNGDEMIFHVNSANALTIDSSQVATFAAGVVSTAASNTLGATSFGDANITNVGSLACSSVVVDAAGTGLDVVFGGNTTKNKMTLTDNLADALNITESSNSYMKFVTTNSGESIVTSKNLVQHPDMTNTALTSQSGSVVINANLGNYFTVATNGAITGLDIQNAVVGQKILIRFAWGGTHSIAYTDTVIWPGGTALSATASGVDVVGFICTTASSAFDAFVIGEDIQAA